MLVNPPDGRFVDEEETGAGAGAILMKKGMLEDPSQPLVLNPGAGVLAVSIGINEAMDPKYEPGKGLTTLFILVGAKEGFMVPVVLELTALVQPPYEAGALLSISVVPPYLVGLNAVAGALKSIESDRASLA